MTDLKALLKTLRSQGWTYLTISKELDVTMVTVQRWAVGRKPSSERIIIEKLKTLLKNDLITA